MTRARTVMRLAAAAPGLFAVGILVSTAVNLVAILPGLFAHAYFDQLANSTGWGPRLSGLLLLFLLVPVLTGGLSMAKVATDVNYTMGIGALLRVNLLRRLLDRPAAQVAELAGGEGVSALRDDVGQITGFLSSLTALIGQLFCTIVAVAILVWTDYALTAAVLTPILVLTVIASYARGSLVHFRRARREADSGLFHALAETFAAAALLQAMGAQGNAAARLERLGEKRKGANCKDAVARQGVDGGLALAGGLGVGLLLWLAGGRVSSGQFTLGEFALFVSYVNYVMAIPTVIGGTVAGYRQMGVSFDRLARIGMAGDLVTGRVPRLRASRSESRQDGAESRAGVRRNPGERLEWLEMRNVSYHYPSGGQGIEDVCFTARRGTLTVIAGEVGAGKTTLLRTLVGSLEPQEGEVVWNGNPVTARRDWFVPPQCSYAPQVPHLFEGTLLDNILLGIPADAARVDRAVEAAALTEDVTMMEDGLATQIGPRGGRLSGGQAHRLSIARALVRNAELVMLDDVTIALDKSTEEAFWDHLPRSAEVTYLVVSNSPAAWSRADQILLLQRGRLVAAGSPTHLLDSSAELQRLWQRADNPSLCPDGIHSI